MKTKIFILSLIFILSYSCKEKEKTNEETAVAVPEQLSLKGSWELKGFYNYQDNKVVDSFSNNTISRQIKMFSDTKVMWCKLRPADSTEFFGYGSYTYEDGQLTEVLDFGSSFMNEVIAEQKEFNFQLHIFPDRFEQIELDEEGNKIFSENYIRIE
ncbi:MAG: hypothetical protein NWP87_06545 [Winogradskyella sp.]|nr:hypothetical protein [Winogradskyella sp.]